MKIVEYTIKDALGHPRSTGGTAGQGGRQVCLENHDRQPEKEVDAKRIMGVMSLGVKCGDTVKITIEGEDEETAAAAMQAFFEGNL